MVAEEGNRAQLVDFAGSDHQNELNDLFLLGLDAQPIEKQEQIGRCECSAFVSVNKWMVLRDAEQIGRRKFAEIWIPVCFLLQRACERRFQHSFIPDASSAAVEAQLLSVQRLHELAGMVRTHFASAR